jgi:hypothetical protein
MRARNAARDTVDRLRSARPAPLLAALVLAQFGVVAWIAFGTPHNGWIWYSGGDATEYWTSQWAVAHGWIPQALVGWGLPVLYGWVPLLAGSTLLVGLPVIVLFHVLVLVPLALVLVWALADRLYGRTYAWAVAVLWVIAPLLASRAFVPRYRPRFEENILAPHWAGLTDMADLPSLVAVLAAAWATARAVQSGRFGSAIGAGVLGGLALGLKPANGYFLLAVAVFLLASWRPRAALGWIVGLAPALVTLTIWKARGLGTIPILSAYAPRREASSAVLGLSATKYVPFDWHHLSVQWLELREVFWDLRFLQFLLVAAALGALRRNLRAGLFLIVWFVAFCILKGMSSQADISTTSYFRLTLPGLAALVLLLPAIAFLLPGTRRAPWAVPAESWTVALRTPLSAVAACACIVPLAVVLVEHPAPKSPARLARYAAGTEAPVSSRLTARAETSGSVVTLSWHPAESTGGARLTYAVIRTTGGDGCSSPTSGAGQCFLNEPILTWTPKLTLSDRPGHGRFFYRIVAVADNRGNPQSSDLMLVGPAVSVRV